MALEYEFKNFKAFPSSGSLPLRPITLIYGPNSSGKSSVLQSLLLLKQTLDESETAETLLLPKGNYVDLGSYREFVYRHELDRPFSIRLNLPIAGRKHLRNELDLLNLSEVGLRITFGYDQSAGNAIATEFAYFADGLRDPFCVFKPDFLKEDEMNRVMRRTGVRQLRSQGTFRGSELNEKHPVWARLWQAEQDIAGKFLPDLRRQVESLEKQIRAREELELETQSEIASGTTPRKRRSRRPIDKDAIHQQIADMQGEIDKLTYSLSDAPTRYLDRLRNTFLTIRNFLPGEAVYIPPEEERTSPTRYVDFMIYGPSSFQQHLLAAVTPALRRFLDDLVYIGPLRESPERHYIFSGNVSGQVGKTGRQVPDVLFKNRRLLSRVNEQLEAFGINYELVVAGATDGELNDVFALRLRDRETEVSASILDVGFGISQVLPVIVQSLLSTGKTLCIEQPEIHLHPRLQADLGSLFARAIREPYLNRFIVETHSQHLLLRVQKLIREGALRSDEVLVLYVNKSGQGSECLELRLDERGEFIDEWPHGFFEEGYQEMFGS